MSVGTIGSAKGTRRPGEPTRRIEQRIHAALGDAETVLNVGAAPSVRRGQPPWVRGLLGAFWARPEAYLDPAVRAGMSTLRAGDPAAVAAGLARLEEDLASGECDARHGDLREQAECDLGYRLVVATTG